MLQIKERNGNEYYTKGVIDFGGSIIAFVEFNFGAMTLPIKDVRNIVYIDTNVNIYDCLTEAPNFGK